MPGGYKLPRGATVTNPEFVPTSDGRRALIGGTLEDSAKPGAAIEPIYREADIESQVIDLDGTYDADRWSAHGQVGYTQAEGGSDRDQNYWFEFFFQAEDGIRDVAVTGVQTCALPI